MGVVLEAVAWLIAELAVSVGAAWVLRRPLLVVAGIAAISLVNAVWAYAADSRGIAAAFLVIAISALAWAVRAARRRRPPPGATR